MAVSPAGKVIGSGGFSARRDVGRPIETLDTTKK